jgi:kinesin family protein 6/9
LIPKQEAFVEFKAAEGAAIEKEILEQRDSVKEGKQQIRQMTQACNLSKVKIDQVKQKLEQKAEEKKFERREDFGEDEEAEG